MKNITKFLALAALLVGSASCSDILKEQPRSTYTPEFFSTETGIQGGLTSMYAHLRYLYGQAYWYNPGTDMEGNFIDNRAAVIDLYQIICPQQCIRIHFSHNITIFYGCRRTIFTFPSIQ